MTEMEGNDSNQRKEGDSKAICDMKVHEINAWLPHLWSKLSSFSHEDPLIFKTKDEGGIKKGGDSGHVRPPESSGGLSFKCTAALSPAGTAIDVALDLDTHTHTH